MKLRIGDRREFMRRLKRIKAKPARSRVHEMNTLYDTHEGGLAQHGQMLRLRVERPAGRAHSGGRRPKFATAGSAGSALVTFKGPVNGASASEERYKIREEHELRISSPAELPKIFKALGLRPWFRYEKFRSLFRLPGARSLKLALDETPIGLFVELEGKREEIDLAAERLGFARRDYITKSYGALFMEERGVSREGAGIEPVPSSGLADMLFGS